MTGSVYFLWKKPNSTTMDRRMVQNGVVRKLFCSASTVSNACCVTVLGVPHASVHVLSVFEMFTAVGFRDPIH